jgi:hypothetical protein
MLCKSIIFLIPLDSSEDIAMNLGLLLGVIRGMLTLDAAPIAWGGPRHVFLKLIDKWDGVHKWLDANKGSGTASQTAHQAGLLPLIERQLRSVFSLVAVYRKNGALDYIAVEKMTE